MLSTCKGQEVQEGLDLILTHFRDNIFPRHISTAVTHGAQVLVSSREEALARFAQANFRDCRIAAYPQPSVLSSFVGVNLDIAPSIIMIDLDKGTFKTQVAFETALTKTQKKFQKP